MLNALKIWNLKPTLYWLLRRLYTIFVIVAMYRAKKSAAAFGWGRTKYGPTRIVSYEEVSYRYQRISRNSTYKRTNLPLTFAYVEKRFFERTRHDKNQKPLPFSFLRNSQENMHTLLF